MKFFMIFCVFAVLGAVVLASNASWGARDSLLFREITTRNPISNVSQNVEVVCPPKAKIYWDTITAIIVQDNFKNSSGAIPYIIAGGVGYNNVKLLLVSKESCGINSTVEIYGARR